MEVDYGDSESKKCMRAYAKAFSLLIGERSLEELEKDLEDIRSIPEQFYEKDLGVKQVIEGAISRIEKRIKQLENKD